MPEELWVVAAAIAPAAAGDTHMAKLGDTQAVILTHAAARDGGSLYPLPDTLRRSGGTMNALAALVKAGWAEPCRSAAAA